MTKTNANEGDTTGTAASKKSIADPPVMMRCRDSTDGLRSATNSANKTATHLVAVLALRIAPSKNYDIHASIAFLGSYRA